MREEICRRDPVMTSIARTAIVMAATTATGPAGLWRHGPDSATAAMRATNNPTAPTTPSMGGSTRHQGNRLARNVEAGTLAAATATTRTALRAPSRVWGEPTLPVHTRKTRR